MKFHRVAVCYATVCSSYTLGHDYVGVASSEEEATANVQLGMSEDAIIWLVGHDDRQRSLATISDIFPTAQYLNPANGAGHSFSLAIDDVDGDGFKDIVFGNYNGENELYINSGGPEGYIPTAPSSILPGGSLPQWATAMGDFNNDGSSDIFMANWGSIPPQLLLNDGDGNFLTVQDLTIVGRTYVSAHEAHAVDINNDGNIDVVISEYLTSSGSNVLLGDGTGNFTAIELSDRLHQTVGVGSADFDRDGDIDLVFASTQQVPRSTYLFLNDGNVTHPSFTQQTISHTVGSPHGYGVAVGDVNNDGWDDFIVLRKEYGTNLLFINDAVTGEVPSFTQSELPGKSGDGYTGVDIADVNGDTFPDVVIGNYGQPNQLLINNGSGGFDADGVFELPGVPPNTCDVKFADINGDTMIDIVIANGSNGQKVLLINALPAPSTSPGDVWQIVFTGLDANFTSTSDTELVLQYDIGKNPPSGNSTTGRYKTTLYENDCATEISTSGGGPLLFSLTDNGRIAKSPTNTTFDAIDLMYDVNKTLIAASPVWNSATNEIEICQVVQLIEQSSSLGELVIIEDKRVVTIDFDLSANFEVDTNLEKAALTSANRTAGVEDYVTAYKCDDNFVQDASTLVANDELYICIESSSADVEIYEVQNMIIKQAGIDDFTVITDSIIALPALTEETIVSPIKQVVMTRLPSNIIDFALGNTIAIEGMVVMQLAGSNGRMLQVDTITGGGGGPEVAAASFDINVALQPDTTLDEASILNSAASFASKTCAAFGAFILVSAVW
eukprot:CAMPEP_0172554436 /NCGR_PEP_ID=MMETSP1067-20121228/54526_1 /TAXON_ID=265564 ORGANISM="Thalassiosira punctigera, Strain Tpunct2005C2" /NCGR_SAMPLE_ID=MMETSP1067 /ASSEMBLY_ACC=CAM_ASM_000444 /LENGTH=782 /DNA_ID=CAMNT_0013342805 /DNA_START=118 /DNA_END=2466 /DNA_ORIENTATION=+